MTGMRQGQAVLTVNGDSSDGDKIRAGWKATVPFSCCLSSFCHDVGFLALKPGIPGLNRAKKQTCSITPAAKNTVQITVAAKNKKTLLK